MHRTRNKRPPPYNRERRENLSVVPLRQTGGIIGVREQQSLLYSNYKPHDNYWRREETNFTRTRDFSSVTLNYDVKRIEKLCKFFFNYTNGFLFNSLINKSWSIIYFQLKCKRHMRNLWVRVTMYLIMQDDKKPTKNAKLLILEIIENCHLIPLFVD